MQDFCTPGYSLLIFEFDPKENPCLHITNFHSHIENFHLQLHLQIYNSSADNQILVSRVIIESNYLIHSVISCRSNWIKYIMSVTAKQLSKSGAKGKNLDGIVREQLQIIDTKLLQHDRMWGWNIVAYELPSSFPGAIGLERKEAQRIVYSSILKSIKNRGFQVKVYLSAQQSMVYIGWETDLDPEEAEEMTKLIRGCCLTSEGRREFLKSPKKRKNQKRSRIKPKQNSRNVLQSRHLHQSSSSGIRPHGPNRRNK